VESRLQLDHGSAFGTATLFTLVDALVSLPAGTFGGRGKGLARDDIQRNLAYRDLVRGTMSGSPRAGPWPRDSAWSRSATR
jgi:hypothetical protein